MDKYGIIAGGGELPIIIYNSLKKNNLDVFLIGIKNNFKKVNSIKKYEEVKIGSLSKISKSSIWVQKYYLKKNIVKVFLK